jgi:hypothetical protein
MPDSLPTFAGDGLQPGVHLEDSGELLDLMEADELLAYVDDSARFPDPSGRSP